MTQGRKLKDLRTAYGLTQEQFGNALAITKSSISAYENDRNAINSSVKYKVLQATGIGWDYFDTDMNLREAFEKYGLDHNHLELKSLTECIIGFYSSISDFINKKAAAERIVTKVEVMKFITEYRDAGCCLIKVNNGEGGFMAEPGDILVVIDDDGPLNGEWVIARYKGNIFIIQYFISSNDEVQLISSMNSFKFNEENLKDEFEIAGVIKSKISINTKVRETTIPDYLRK